MSITRDSRLTAHQLTVLRVESLDAQVTVLGSKSYTDRYLAIASLSGQETVIDHACVRVEVDHESERIHMLPTGCPMRAPESRRSTSAVAGNSHTISDFHGRPRCRHHYPHR